MTKKKEGEILAAVVPAEPVAENLTDAEWRAKMSALLDAAQVKRQSEAYTLPQLLGEPQPYEPIPGLFFRRPKLSPRRGLALQFDALVKRFQTDPDPDRDMVDSAALVASYAYVQGSGGEFRLATAKELLEEVFDDVMEIANFCTVLLTPSRLLRQGEDAASPNE